MGSGSSHILGRRSGLRALLGFTFLIVLALVLGLAPAARAAVLPYAPLDQPGPPLDVPPPLLRASLQCEPSVRDAKVEPVLLNPATGVTAEQNYSWNYEPALEMLGIPWCAYTAPHSTLDNVETSGEYLVYAIRTMYALAGRRIAIIGHSQGGMSMRWPLRFWPDTRSMVEDVIGLSGSNHGTTVGGAGICGDGCPPADWQQFAHSNFIGALNSGVETFSRSSEPETPAGDEHTSTPISYTEIYTHTDEVVQPNSGPDASAALHTGSGAITNVATQDICPGDTDEHLAVGTVDPVAYALAIDAITHPGPADPARIPKSVCSQVYMPGVNPANVNTYLQILAGAPGLASVGVGPAAGATTGAPVVKAEPPLACYVFASCTGAAAPALQIYTINNPRSLRVGRRTLIHVLVRTPEGSALAPVPGVNVTVAGHRAITDADGDITIVLRFTRAGSYRLLVTRAGCDSAGKTLRVIR